jgi:hypothetical protein
MFECLQEDKELDDQHTKVEFHILKIYSRHPLPQKDDMVQYFSKEEGVG